MARPVVLAGLLRMGMCVVPECAVQNVGYVDPHVPSVNGGMGLTDALTCQHSCENLLGCKAFTYYANSGGCWLQGMFGELPAAQEMPGVFSGPAVCLESGIAGSATEYSTAGGATLLTIAPIPVELPTLPPTPTMDPMFVNATGMTLAPLTVEFSTAAPMPSLDPMFVNATVMTLAPMSVELSTVPPGFAVIDPLTLQNATAAAADAADMTAATVGAMATDSANTTMDAGIEGAAAAVASATAASAVGSAAVVERAASVTGEAGVSDKTEDGHASGEEFKRGGLPVWAGILIATVCVGAAVGGYVCIMSNGKKTPKMRRKERKMRAADIETPKERTEALRPLLPQASPGFVSAPPVPTVATPMPAYAPFTAMYSTQLAPQYMMAHAQAMPMHMAAPMAYAAPVAYAQPMPATYRTYQQSMQTFVVAQPQDAFAFLDRNHDGILSREEFYQMSR